MRGARAHLSRFSALSPAGRPSGGALKDTFHRVAQRAAATAGHAGAFLGAVLLIAVWLGTGPMFHYSDTWQLVINTTTTIVTFLMVFLIQNTQNRDSHAIHLKLDELIRAHASARNRLLALENLSDDEMDVLQAEFERIRDVKSARE